MKDNIQSLPQDLRTKHPKRWTTENIVFHCHTDGLGKEQALGKGNLDTKEGRQSVVDIFTKRLGSLLT